jgi:gliding motility-associated-like protein
MRFLFLIILLHVSTLPLQAQLNPENLIKSRDSRLIENRGQVLGSRGEKVNEVLFYSSAKGLNFYITKQGISFILFQPVQEGFYEQESEEGQVNWERIDLELRGANIQIENCIKLYPSEDQSLNFINAANPEGIYGVQEYQKVIFKDIYPHIDWEIYQSLETGIKYDLILHPGANPDDIQLVYGTKEKITLSESGDLSIETSLGSFKELAPVSFLNDKKIRSSYRITDRIGNEKRGYNNHIKFDLESAVVEQIKNPSSNEILILDPELVWCTVFGGNGLDGITGIEIYNNDFYLGGYTVSLNFPTYQINEAYYQSSSDTSLDGVLLKFDNNGKLMWSTAYGGSQKEFIRGIKFDSNGSLYAIGYTYSDDFPLENLGGYFQDTKVSVSGFILKFNNAGHRTRATFLGTIDCYLVNLVVDSKDNLFVTGYSKGYFPLKDNGEFFYGLAMSSGYDGYIGKFDKEGNYLWGTNFGGTSTNSWVGHDYSFGLAVNSFDDIYVVGETLSQNFPLMDNGGYFRDQLEGSIESFIMRFSNAGALKWSTFYGGNNIEFAKSVTIDNENNVLVVGYTETQNLDDMLNSAVNSGEYFIQKYDVNNKRVWGRYFGGSTQEIIMSLSNYHLETYNNQVVVDKCNNYFLALDTKSKNMETLSFCGSGYMDDGEDKLSSQYLAMLNEEGQILGATYFGGAGKSFRANLATDSYGNLWLTGEWIIATDTLFGYPLLSGDANAYYDDTHNGMDDTFIAKFNTANNVGACYCDHVDHSNEPVFIHLPNVFTPNGDGINDKFFKLNSSGVKTVELNILNRWGQVVFQTNDINFVWNGLDQSGLPVMDGTYFWVAKIEDFNKKKHKENGFLVVIHE